MYYFTHGREIFLPLLDSVFLVCQLKELWIQKILICKLYRPIYMCGWVLIWLIKFILGQDVTMNILLSVLVLDILCYGFTSLFRSITVTVVWVTMSLIFSTTKSESWSLNKKYLSFVVVIKFQRQKQVELLWSLNQVFKI